MNVEVWMRMKGKMKMVGERITCVQRPWGVFSLVWVLPLLVEERQALILP